MYRRIVVTALVIVLSVVAIYADRGLIPFEEHIKIFEPNQRAMIAWSGSEEILLLSTDLSASDSTMVLEVLPLPSEPEVKKGDLETFTKAVDLINSRMVLDLREGRSKSYDKAPPPAEVTFHKKIGAHDISVTHLLHTKGFIEWVKEYLKSIGVEKDIVSNEMKKLIEEYTKDGFAWFVFDVVSLGKETVTNEPIQYRFKNKSLFFPLKITKTGEGYTSIELLILTPRLLRNFPGVPIDMIELKHKPITISDEELKELNEDMYELLGKYEDMKLRIWNIEGELKSFDKDLVAN